MRTAKIVISSIIVLAWLVFAIAQLLSPVAIAILAGLSAGFSVGCVLSIWSYYDPHDETGLVWAEHNSTPKFYLAVISVGAVLVYSSIVQASGLPLAALIGYILPIYAIGRIRPVVPRRRSPDPDDHPHQSCVYDD